ncbi:phenylacetate--CoA ligase family protein [Actinoplanes sp. NPDC051859]|uniref:phenylacetate--CoA ligase family protein n=1 Tax=Actinoplanes sp. NPDC051859 TaxID=3363909 RepID=UPI0037AF9290
MRTYPTDLLLAVEHAERELTDPASALSRLFTHAGMAGLSGLLRSSTFMGALDRLFDGLSQFPWQPQVDTNDVVCITPVGSIVLTDRRAGNTLRGLLLAWAVGDDVIIRSDREAFWRRLVELLRRPGLPLPAATVMAADTQPIRGVPIVVPDVALVIDGPAPGWADDNLHVIARGVDDGSSIRIRMSGAGQPDLLAEDCRASWVQQLYRREYLHGTTLAEARCADAEGTAGRLDAKLRFLIERARRSPFYRDLPAISGRAELHRLPILDKAALDAHSLPASRDLSSGDMPTGEVLRSGASSGQPRYIVYSRTDWSNMVREAIPLFYALGLSPGDRLVNTLFGGGMYGGLTTTISELTRMPVECYSTGQIVSVDDLVMLSRSFSANAILGQPALLLPLLRDAKAKFPSLQFEKVIYGGTPMTESDKAWLREELGARIIASILAANDGAQLGYQCTELGGTQHHICDDYNLIEVVDEVGRPVNGGEPGHLLITAMQKFEGPLIRYRIGDRGRIFPHQCPCGVNGDVLEYLGRSDGLIKVKGRTFLHSEILTELDVFGVSRLQVEIRTKNNREVVTAHVESATDLDEQQLREHLMERIAPLREEPFAVGIEVFEFLVRCHPEGALIRDSVSGKIKTVIDGRLS